MLEPNIIEIMIHAKPDLQDNILCKGEIDLLLSMLPELLAELEQIHQPERD